MWFVSLFSICGEKKKKPVFKPDFLFFKIFFKLSVSGTCKGFIRVVLNLSRPINVLPGTKPPSVLNLTQESLKSQADRTLTSFYLPPETEKTLCVTNATTTQDVIRSLLSKFRIVDNPHKYVLYQTYQFRSSNWWSQWYVQERTLWLAQKWTYQKNTMWYFRQK